MNSLEFAGEIASDACIIVTVVLNIFVSLPKINSSSAGAAISFRVESTGSFIRREKVSVTMTELRTLAKVAELADALVLGTSGVTRGSSNLPFRTTTKKY